MHPSKPDVHASDRQVDVGQLLKQKSALDCDECTLDNVSGVLGERERVSE